MMKHILFVIITACVFGAGCRDADLKELPFFRIEMSPPDMPTLGRLHLTGYVFDLNGEKLESCGFVWSYSSDSVQLHPGALRKIMAVPPEQGSAFDEFFNLKAGQIAYFRAFGQLGERIVFSQNIEMAGLGQVVELDKNPIWENNSATVFGRLIGDEVIPQNLTAFGHVFSSATSQPAIGLPGCDSTIVHEFDANQGFESRLSGLNFNTTYYVRAYALDGDSLFYSQQVDTIIVEDGWIQISQGFPTDFVDGSAVTTGNGTVFAGFGINNLDGPVTDILNQWWQFNPASESWGNAASFSNAPADKRTNASVFAIGDTIYVIFGHQNNPDTRMVRGFWKYSISSNTWGNEVSIPISQNQFTSRSGAAGFVLNGKIYVGAGHKYENSNLRYLNDFWEYNPQTGNWRRVKSLPMNTLNGVSMAGRYDAVGFASQTFGYVGGGEFFGVPTTDFWRFTPPVSPQDSGTWTPLNNPFPGVGRIDGISFTIGEKAYYGCGWNIQQRGLSDFYEFDMTTETWTKRTSFQGGNRRKMLSFALNGDGFAGTGYEIQASNSGLDPVLFKDIWRYVPKTQ